MVRSASTRLIFRYFGQKSSHFSVHLLYNFSSRRRQRPSADAAEQRPGNQAERKILAQDGTQVEQRGVADRQLGNWFLIIYGSFSEQPVRCECRISLKTKGKATTGRTTCSAGIFTSDHHRTGASRARLGEGAYRG